jgi:hypothetical protein
VGNPAADRDGADADIAIVDVPAFVRGLEVSAAGQVGHALLKRGPSRRATAPLGPPLHPEPICADAAVHADGTGNAAAGIRILGIQ